MLSFLLIPLTFHGVGSMSSWECVGLDGTRVSHGEDFIPGPDYCTVCKCEEGKARFCRAVLCQPPQDRKSFHVGTSCCDFICLDKVLPHIPDGDHPNQNSTDLGLRMVASAVTAILSLALLFFLIHRLRQRRLRAQQHFFEDQLDAHNGEVCHGGNCCRNDTYCNVTEHADFFLDAHSPYSTWKPPSGLYSPHGEAPPSYNEAMANSFPVSDSVGVLQPLGINLGYTPEETYDGNVYLGFNDSMVEGIGMKEQQEGNRLSQLSSASLPPVVPDTGEESTTADSSTADSSTADSMRVEATSPEVTIHSDEDLGSSSGEVPSIASQPLNDLNRGTQMTPPASGDARENSPAAEGNLLATAAPVAKGKCICSGANSPDPKCTLCTARPSSTLNIGIDDKVQDNTALAAAGTPVRRRKDGGIHLGNEEQRQSTMEDFRLRLSLDISDSSTSSDLPTCTYSTTSDDSTSMDTTSEMR
ncbi:uncharacterized protein LOC143027720 [Oratosquilla oratoria]|uniref:uncharacterized protein LOC143027720 n=1 Tax=Oratosquilla oratoria TaxID=337810 RepID=UPI003F76340A